MAVLPSRGSACAFFHSSSLQSSSCLLGAPAQAEDLSGRASITLMVPAAAGGGNDTVAPRGRRTKMGAHPRPADHHREPPRRPAAALRRGRSRIASRTATTIGNRNPATAGESRPRCFPMFGYDPVKDFFAGRHDRGEPRTSFWSTRNDPAHSLSELIGARQTANPASLRLRRAAPAARPISGPSCFASMAGIKADPCGRYKGNRSGDLRPARRAHHHDVSRACRRRSAWCATARSVRSRSPAAKRSKILPDVPTVSETVPGYESAQRYDGIIAPAARTPAGHRRQSSKRRAARRAPRIRRGSRRRVAAEGAEITPSTPEGILCRRHRGGGSEVGQDHPAAWAEGGQGRLTPAPCAPLCMMIS